MVLASLTYKMANKKCRDTYSSSIDCHFHLIGKGSMQPSCNSTPFRIFPPHCFFLRHDNMYENHIDDNKNVIACKLTNETAREMEKPLCQRNDETYKEKKREY